MSDEMRFRPPKCDGCGKPLHEVQTRVINEYRFNEGTGEFDISGAQGIYIYCTCGYPTTYPISYRAPYKYKFGLRPIGGEEYLDTIFVEMEQDEGKAREKAVEILAEKFPELEVTVFLVEHLGTFGNAHEEGEE